MKKLLVFIVAVCWFNTALARPVSDVVATPDSHIVATPVSHVVVLWFKANTSKADIRAAATQAQMLTAIEGVIDVRQGPALASDRSHVDDSFDLGLLISFESEAAMRDYVSHPVHKDYVKRYISGRVEKLLVYDF